MCFEGVNSVFRNAGHEEIPDAVLIAGRWDGETDEFAFRVTKDLIRVLVRKHD